MTAGRASLPQRRRKSPGARLRPFRIVLSALALLVLAGIVFAISWRGFAPREIVVTGNRVVSRARILASAHVATDVSMWLQNPAAIARRVARIPYVERVWVYRLPPATLTIRVRERVPFAVVRSGRQAALVDAQLRVLQRVGGADPAPAGVPVFELPPGLALDPGRFLDAAAVTALRDDERLMLAAHVAPVALRSDRFGGLVATMRDGVQVLFGNGADLARKLALVEPILAQVVHGSRRVTAIDLRAPDTPVVVYGR